MSVPVGVSVPVLSCRMARDEWIFVLIPPLPDCFQNAVQIAAELELLAPLLRLPVLQPEDAGRDVWVHNAPAVHGAVLRRKFFLVVVTDRPVKKPGFDQGIRNLFIAL